MSLDPDPIDTAFKVPSRAENKPKNIVVKFKFKQSRDYFLTAAKVARKDANNQRGFNLDGISNRFFINEHLPPKTKFGKKPKIKTIILCGYKTVIFWSEKPTHPG
ncbi:hypothetical protein JTB14_003041 [Gonioctena quinquepunctata]|nr:hypothetical protein JTB14_003041 [Gonioctena quinquepunctata]